MKLQDVPVGCMFKPTYDADVEHVLHFFNFIKLSSCNTGQFDVVNCSTWKIQQLPEEVKVRVLGRVSFR